MNRRPYETEIRQDDNGIWQLEYLDNSPSNLKPLLTPNGQHMKHPSKALLLEIQAELKAGTPNQLIERFSNYQLLCSQIDEFELVTKFASLKRNVTTLLMEDGAFFPMHPPEEVERLYNLAFVGNFLAYSYGSPVFDQYLTSSPKETRPFWGKFDNKGSKFIELRDDLHRLSKHASLEQKVVIHFAYHMSGSLIVSILFAYGDATPKEFALAALACQQTIPDILDEEEQAEMLNYVDRLAGYAGIMLSYLNKSRSDTNRLINGGEGTSVEFKATFRRNLHTGKADKDMESVALKELVAFLNTIGGNLLIGVNDDGSVCGLRTDIFSTDDRYKTHIANQFNLRVGPEHGKYLKYHFDTILRQKVLRIECEKLPATEVAYLDGELYIRNAAQTIKLNTRSAIAWRDNRNADSV